MVLSVVIVSYNTKEFLKECLLSIADSQLTAIEIIVVDNASEDGTVEEVQSNNVKLKIIQNEKNLGYAKANNIGVREAKGDYILFLNPDTLVNKDAIKKMVAFISNHKDVGAVTCRVNLPNGNLDDSCHRGFPTPWNAFCYFSGLSRIFPRSRIFAGYSLGWMDLSKTHEIDSCAGAFMIVRRKAGEEINWWDEDFFWYGEDLDFCYRLKEKGWKIYFVPGASILHYKGISGGIKGHSKHLSTATRETKTRAINARFEAMELFYKKHYENKYPSFVTWFVSQAIKLKRLRALKSV